MNKEKIRYVILKETEKGELFNSTDKSNFEQLDLGFGWEQFEEQVNFLVKEGYLTKPFYAGNTICIYSSKLTEKGEEYLNNNRLHVKAYKFVKEIKEWISL